MRKTSLALIVAALFACSHAPAAPAPAAPAAPPAAAAATAVASTPAPAPAADALKPPVKVSSVEGVSEYVLQNGLRVLLLPDPSQSVVITDVVYLVGSRHEGYGETGMAHLLEHMLFKGSPKFPDFDAAVRQKLGDRSNASTWFDRTNYFFVFPAEEERLAFALDVESDRMLNANIAAEELAKEFSVVRNEFEIGENDPEGVLSERMLSTAYLWHNYGKSTIGSRADIERVPADRLKRFYKKYYRPENAVLIVGGKFDSDKTLALINDKFARLANPKEKLEPTYTVEPVQDGERTVILRRVGDVQIVGVVYHTVAYSDERAVAAEAIAHILADEPEGRLYKALVKPGLASRVTAMAWNWNEPGWLEISAEVPKGKPLEPVRDKLLQVTEDLAKNKPTEKEVAAFKARAAKNFELNQTQVVPLVFGLQEATAAGDWRLYFLRRDRAAKLTAAAVAGVAATFLKKDNRTVGMFIPTQAPDRSPLTERPDVVALVKDYQGRAGVQLGEEFEPTLDNIDKHTTRETLPSGLKLALLSKKTRGDSVSVRLALHFGNDKDLVGADDALDLLNTMLMRGTKKYTYEQLKEEMDKLKARLNTFVAGGDAGVVVTTTKENLVPVLALAAEVLKNPSFPAAQFDIAKKEHLTELEAQLSEPRSRAFEEIQRRLSPYPKGDVRYHETLEEQIAGTKAVKLEDLKRLHGTLWGASNTEVVVIGAFDPGAVKDAIATQLGDWKSVKPYRRIELPYKDVKADTVKIDTPDKESAILVLGHTLKLKDNDPDYPALYMANFILGGAFDSRITERVRQKEGWAYGSGSALRVDALDDGGQFFAFAFCAPQNADKARKAIIEEIDRLVKDGVGADELAKAKLAYKANFDGQLASDQVVAGILQRNLYLGRPLDFQKQLNEKILKLTPDDIKRVLAKGYVQSSKLVQITAGDMKKAAEQK